MLTTKNWGAGSFKSFWMLALAFFVGCQEPGPRSLLQGEALLKTGKYTEAIERLRTATELLPQNAQAWNHLGLALHGAGQISDAIKAYQKALSLDRNLAAVRFNLGSTLVESGNYPAAAAELTSYTVLQPSSPEAWVSLGTALLRSRRLDEAERAFVTADKLRPNTPEVLNGLGLIQAQKRRPREAAQLFANALRQDPKYAPSLLNLAVVAHQALNNKAYALQRYREYVLVAPNETNVPAVRDVIRDLDLELQPKPVPVRITNQVLGAVVTNETPPTRITNVSSSLPPRTNSGRALVVPKAPETNATVIVASPPQSKTNLQTTPRVEPEPVPVKIDAVPISEDFTIKPVKDLPVTKLEVSTAATNAPAITSTNSATNGPVERLSPPIKPEVKQGFVDKMTDKLNPLGWFRGKEKLPEVRKPALPVAGTNPIVRTLPAPQAAQPLPRVAEKIDWPRYTYRSPAPGLPGKKPESDAALTRGVEAHTARRYDEALSAYESAAQLDPSSFEAYYNMAAAALETKNYPRSMLASEHALAVKPDSADARFNFALALQGANYFLDAAVELERALRQSPNLTRAHLTLANLYAQKLGEPRQAREHYLRVLQLAPDHPLAPQIRGWLAAH